MSEANTETIKTVDHKPHAAFFRQSGWLMVAAIVGGAMTWGVHFLTKSIPQVAIRHLRDTADGGGVHADDAVADDFRAAVRVGAGDGP